MTRIEHHLLAMETARDLGIGTVRQLHALLAIASQGRLKLTRLAGLIGCSTVVITGVADRLVELGLARRIHDRQDRRAVFLEITAAGTAAVESLTRSVSVSPTSSLSANQP